jgi:hypothetical protein
VQYLGPGLGVHGKVGERISHAVGSTCVVGSATDGELVRKTRFKALIHGHPIGTELLEDEGAVVDDFERWTVIAARCAETGEQSFLVALFVVGGSMIKAHGSGSYEARCTRLGVHPNDTCAAAAGVRVAAGPTILEE